MTSIHRILFCNISNNYNIPWWSFAIPIAITILTVCFSNSIIKTNSGWVIFAIAIPKTIQAGALLRYQFQLQYQYYCRNAISEPIYLSIWYYCAALLYIIKMCLEDDWLRSTWRAKRSTWPVSACTYIVLVWNIVNLPSPNYITSEKFLQFNKVAESLTTYSGQVISIFWYELYDIFVLLSSGSIDFQANGLLKVLSWVG